MKRGNDTCSASASRNWDQEADVVVVGYGGAGAVSAISAHDGAAQVLILEGMPGGGGNTLVSFGGFLCPTNVPDAITYLSGLYELSHSDKDERAVRVFVEEAVKNVEWVTGLRAGTEVQVYGGAGFPQVPGAESMKKYIVKGEGKGANVFARNLWDLLTHAVERERGIPVMANTRARRLVTGTAGEVVGVVAERDGKEISICARRAVILTTDGYEFDAGMLQNSAKGFPIYSLGCPGNRGDGIRMAQKAEAGLWHMNGVSFTFGIKVPEFLSALGMTLRPAAHIFVDRNGRRFVNERDIETHAALLAVDYYDACALMYPRIPRAMRSSTKTGGCRARSPFRPPWAPPGWSTPGARTTVLKSKKVGSSRAKH
jgi:succinate dehydrogenase/fumarate reductase flavoprotein subunit